MDLPTLPPSVGPLLEIAAEAAWGPLGYGGVSALIGTYNALAVWHQQRDTVATHAEIRAEASRLLSAGAPWEHPV